MFVHVARISSYCRMRNAFSVSVPNVSSRGFNTRTSDIFKFSKMVYLGGSVSLVSWVALKNALYRADCAAKVQFSRISDASDHLRNSSPASSSMPWAFLWSMLKPYLLLLAGAVVSALLVAWLNIEIPRLLGSIIGVVSKFIVNERPIAGEVADASNTPFGAEFFAAIKAPALRLLAVYAFQANMTYIYLRMLSSLGERVASDLRRKLLDSLLVQDITFFDDHRTGDLVNRLTTDVQDFKSSFKLCVSQGLRSSAQALGCLVSAYFISPEMTRMMALVVPAMILVGATIGSSLRRLSKESQAQIAKATAVADEAIGNIRVVRAFGMEEQEKSLYAQEVDKAREFSEKLGHGIALFQGLTNFGLNCLSLGILFLGGSLVSTGQLGAGDLMSFLMATQTIQRSLGQISLIYGHYVRGSTAAGRVYEFLDASPVICIRGGLIIPEQRLKGLVQFEDVGFSYPNHLRKNELVLKGLCLELKPGQTVALCGPSGGGKSTIAALLERFYDTSEGRVLIDNADIRSLDPTWLRTNVIGYISQDPVLFATSIKENIRYGRPSASEAEVMEAAKMANAHDFISSFPDGYDTMVGERGVALSGGQKQRITIARALLKDPKILILDEATSALDTESEAIVQQALDKAMEGRTTLVIAHRLSTIRNADVIAVIVRGELVESGSHEELLTKRGVYWQLIAAQSSAAGSSVAASLFS